MPKMPRPYILLGERCSGTNIIEQVIAANSPFRPDWSLVGFKHFPRHQDPSVMHGISAYPVVLVVRQALPWIRSLYRQPWHAAPELKRLDFSTFIRTPWYSVWDLDSGTSCNDSHYMEEMMLDRDPTTHERYQNVLLLRAGKLRAMLHIAQRSECSLIVRLEDYVHSPVEVSRHILRALGMSSLGEVTIPLGYRGLEPRSKRFLQALLPWCRISAQPTQPLTPVFADDLRFIDAHLDSCLEAQIGYPSDDCKA
jgi:hypothetical protein